MVRTHYLRGAATLAFQAYQYQRRLEEGDDSLNLDFNTGSKGRRRFDLVPCICDGLPVGHVFWSYLWGCWD